MKIFITGASGFIGGAIANKLKLSHEIFAMTRSEESAKKVRALGLTPIKSDLLSLKAEQLKDIDIVIHCAAFAEEWGTEKEFYDANVLGTQVVLAAAKFAGVKRFLFIGTEAAFFDGHDLLNIDESTPYPDYTPYLYSRTKGQAEKLVLKANEPGFTTISIRPRLVWGPKDESILPIVLDMVKKNQFMWIDHGEYEMSTTHIDNLVHAIEQSLIYGEGGEAYFVADEGTISMKDFLSAGLATQGIAVPTKSMPKFLARGAARLSEGFWKLAKLKSKPPLVRLPIDMMSAHCTLNTSKAKRVLKYRPPVSRDEGIRRLAEP